MSPVRSGPRSASLRPLRAAALLLAALLWTLPVHAQDDPLVIHFLDVGQGDAVLVEEPEGGTVLYDGGPSRETALHHLEALGVEDVDLVVASHPHLDHVGGLPAVLETYTPQFVIDNGLTHTTRAYERYLEAVDRAGSQLLEPELRTITVGEMDLRVLPPPNRPGWGLNDNSVGLVVAFGEFRAMLGGDAEQRQWRWWLNEGVVPEGPVQVHKASHHCSRNGDTRGGIERLRPRVVVIGVGADNRFGHPHPEALALHGAVDAEVYRTDQHGTVRVVAHENGGFEVETERDVPHAALEPDGEVCVDVNRAGVERLQEIIHIGPRRARQIVDLRRQRPFALAEDLTRVKGIGPSRIRDLMTQGLACVDSGRQQRFSRGVPEMVPTFLPVSGRDLAVDPHKLMGRPET